MANADLDVIKDIPGYKVILKAVVRSQIQQLVEQLAAHTEEESIILTASVADGTLSHIGSESGKSFLEDHEDVKSQFLGFCLKYNHRKKQEEKERERLQQEQLQQEKMAQMLSAAAANYAPRPRFMPTRSPRAQRYPSPRGGGAIGRGMGQRHEPYPVSRPVRRSTPSSSTEGQVIKSEPQNNDDGSNQSGANVGTTGDGPSTPTNRGVGDSDDARSEHSSSTLPLVGGDGSNLDTDFSNILSGGDGSNLDNPSATNMPGSSGSQLDVTNEGDSNVSVKLEAISEGDMELEITGVEPGRPIVPQDDWGANMSYDQSGATGTMGDMSASQGYSSVDHIASIDELQAFNAANAPIGQFKSSATPLDTGSSSIGPYDQLTPPTGENEPIDLKPDRKWPKDIPYPCPLCGKILHRKKYMKTHMRYHTGERPFQCCVCGKGFADRSNYKKHEHAHQLKMIKNEKKAEKKAAEARAKAERKRAKQLAIAQAKNREIAKALGEDVEQDVIVDKSVLDKEIMESVIKQEIEDTDESKCETSTEDVRDTGDDNDTEDKQ